MSPSTNSISAVGPKRLVPSLRVFSTRFARRTFLDRAARYVVTLGGVVIIAAILAILVVLVSEVYPLLRPATALPLAPVKPALDGRVLAIETDEYQAAAAVVTEAGIRFVSLTDGSNVGNADLPALGAAKVTAVSSPGGQSLALGLSDGRVLPLEIGFHYQGGGSGRRGVDVRPMEPKPHA